MSHKSKWLEKLVKEFENMTVEEYEKLFERAKKLKPPAFMPVEEFPEENSKKEKQNGVHNKFQRHSRIYKGIDS